jgi:hypothetical protein
MLSYVEMRIKTYFVNQFCPKTKFHFWTQLHLFTFLALL